MFGSLDQWLTTRKTFFQLMRGVDWLAQTESPGDAGAARSRRRPDWLNLTQVARMDFAPGEVSEIAIRQPAFAGDAYRLDVEIRHFGLFAPYGPMPLYLTEHALNERRHDKNPAFERFLGMLSAELAWLDYRAWSHMSPVLGFDRPRRSNAFIGRVAQFAAVPLQARPAEPAASSPAAVSHVLRVRSHFPGLYLTRHRPLDKLCRLLAAYFEVPVRATARTGGWHDLASQRLPAKRAVGRWLLGRKVFAPQSAFTLVLGPVDMPGFTRFHPSRAALRALVDIANDYVGGQVDTRVAVDVRTRRGMNGVMGRMRVGIDSWASPIDAVVRLVVHDVGLRRAG